jgi:hypothetical protein
VTATLQLTQNAFVRHLAFEMFDGAIKSAVSDHDLYGLALNGFSNHRRSFRVKTGSQPYTTRRDSQV